MAGALVVFLLLFLSERSYAQEHQHDAPASPAGQLIIPEQREGSGTSWLPDETPMLAVHGPTLRGWRTMLHGLAFVQAIKDEEPRGHAQVGSINWLMGHARRPLGSGELMMRGMVSLEPLTISGCGYPDLLASGEVCDGEGIVDQQHPHDLVMELAALYRRPLSARVAVQIYGGLAGEPALGPVAFPHRVSALLNPLAPIAHHWLDATHISYGVMTGGIVSRRWKVESSLFNGREPDEHRYDLDLAAFDSYSGRVTMLPGERWALQFSAGHLTEAEEHDGDRVDVDRLTASATYHRPLSIDGIWATTAAWGRNTEESQPTHAFLVETSALLRDRHLMFGRAELVEKTVHDLAVEGPGDRTFHAGKLQLGYSQFFAALRDWRIGLGASVSIGVVPQLLTATYGGRAPLGAAVFLTARPKTASH